MKHTNDLEHSIENLQSTTTPATDQRILTSASAALAQSTQTYSDSKQTSSRRSIMKNHWPKFAAAAAVLAVAILGSWWFQASPDMASSAYAQLLQAVDNSKSAEWLHMQVISGDGDEDEERWMSFKPYRQFVKRGSYVRAVDYQSGLHWTYDPEGQTVSVSNIIDTDNLYAQADNLLDLIILDIKRIGGEIQRAEISIDGKRFATLTARRQGSDGYIQCTIDPQQNRIVHIEVLENHAAQAGDAPMVVKLKYPESGPVDIYELGVPRDAKIVDRTRSQDPEEGE